LERLIDHQQLKCESTPGEEAILKKYRIWIFLILCNLFWAGNYVFGKFVINEMTPLQLTFIRWLLASGILLVIAHFYEKPDWKSVWKSWPILAILGFNGIIAYNLALYSALNYTSPTNASLVSALNPALMVGVSALFLKEKLKGLQRLGIVVSLTGVFVVLTGGSFARLAAFDFNRGDLLMLVAITVWTLYSILGKRLKKVPPITATAVSALISTVILLPFAARQGFGLSSLSPLATLGIAYIVLFPSVGSFIFWNVSVREVGAAQASVFLNLIPVFTSLISFALGDQITLVQISGGALVFLGVYLTTGMLEKMLARWRKTAI
jgi:drug/metabolite transporter (DMT)-like permease